MMDDTYLSVSLASSLSSFSLIQSILIPSFFLSCFSLHLLTHLPTHSLLHSLVQSPIIHLPSSSIPSPPSLILPHHPGFSIIITSSTLHLDFTSHHTYSLSFSFFPRPWSFLLSSSLRNRSSFPIFFLVCFSTDGRVYVLDWIGLDWVG